MRKVEELEKDGIWDNEMSDVLPLAAANMFKKYITIYTRKLHSPVIHVSPYIEGQVATEHIKIAYLALPGYEHYASCVLCSKTKKSSQPTCSPPSEKLIPSGSHNSVPKTPTKRSDSLAGEFATPRKKADYTSPKRLSY